MNNTQSQHPTPGARRVLAFLYDPRQGDAKEEIPTGCSTYSAILLTWNMRTRGEEPPAASAQWLWVIMDGPGMDAREPPLRGIESLDARQEALDFIRDFIARAHRLELCPCQPQTGREETT